MRTAIFRSLFAAIVLASMCRSAVFATGQNAPANTPKLEGNWRGDSLCVANRAVCSDEKVVYRFSTVPGKPGYVSVTADKIVNGEAVAMETQEFQHDRGMRTLVSKSPQGVWLFKVDGNKMEGTLTLPDKTILRRVTLIKED